MSDQQVVVVVDEESSSVEIRETTSVVVVDPGLVGPQGPQGEPGAGAVPTWWSGEGPPPPVIVGATAGDMYVDTLNGVVYQLT